MVWSVLERARRAKKRKWIFRLLALAFPFLVLAGIECGLRLGNVGIDAHLVVRNLRAGRMTSYCLHPQFDVAYCGIDLRGPEPREFELPKPPKMLRVAVVGASTVQGYPYPSELAFPQHMELLLSRQIADREISVINCGIIGLSTTPLVEVVSQVLVAAPDVIVFYEGHNEFYGVGGVATNAKLDSLTIHARRYRLGQLLTKWKSANVFDSESLISQLPGDLWIDNESDLVTQAAERYRRNLRTVASLCVRAKVPLVLCLHFRRTVISGLGRYWGFKKLGSD